MNPLEDTLMSTLHDAVLSYPQGGAKAVASKLGKGYHRDQGATGAISGSQGRSIQRP